MKHIKALLYVTVACCFVFSLTTVSFTVGAEPVAFPLSFVFSLVLSYVVIIRLIRKNDAGVSGAVQKCLEYAPFVLLTAFVLRRANGEMPLLVDVLCIVLWVAVLVLSIVVCVFLKKEDCPYYAGAAKKLRGVKWVLKEAIEWIDALVQAAFVVTLINIFFFQLYEIPSESMVPQFLIGDRVVVAKTASGPAFPLSRVSLPTLHTYKRGDIVVFRNPHYEKGAKSEFRYYISQLVHMLTFTTVNLNVDENGNGIPDPLVKRVTGVPGEQLVMVDGILYARTKENPVFAPVSEDATWAKQNLNELPKNIKKDVQYIPFTDESYAVLGEVEQKRRELDLQTAKDECFEIAQAVSDIRSFLNGIRSSTKSGTGASAGISGKKFIDRADMTPYALFSNVQDISLKILTSDEGEQWFTAFMTDWAKTLDSSSFGATTPCGDDLYEESMYRLNVLMKLTFGKLVWRNAQFAMQGVPFSTDDDTRNELLNDAQKLYFYTLNNDSRNMCVFPPNVDGAPSFIPEKNYFLMGDNRFNSLDMRHSYDFTKVSVCPLDEYSFVISSRLSPRLVGENRILGTTAVRFWPLSRFGSTKAKKEK